MSLKIKLELEDDVNLEELLDDLKQEFNIDDIDITSERWMLWDALENYLNYFEGEEYFLWMENQNIIFEALAKLAKL